MIEDAVAPAVSGHGEAGESRRDGGRWKRLGFLGPPIVLLFVTLALCWRVWSPISGARRAFPWDAQWEYWGDIAFQVDAWKDGEPPLWDPFDRCGYPFASDPQAGVLYPVTWLLVVAGAIAGAKFWLVSVKVMFHVWWWALGCYAWLRRRGTPAAACYAAGIFCVLAYPASAWFSALNWGMAWAPWALLAIDVWAEAPSARGAAWVALAFGMCQLAGAPASFWYTLLVAAPYAAWALVHHGRGRGRSYARAAALSAALAAALFLVMVAGQILATAALVPHTVRAERSLEFIADSVVRADDLFGLFVPRMPGLNLYVGVVTVLAAAVALTVRPSGRSYTLAGIAVAGVLLAIGSGAGFLPSFASFVPLAGLFRKAHRYTYVMTMPVAALGAEGLATLASLEAADVRRRVARWLVGIGVASGIVFAVGVVTSGHGPAHDAYIYAFFSWLLSAWVLRQVVAAEDRWRMTFVAFAAVLLAFDVWFARAPTIEQSWWAEPTTPNDAEASRLPDVPLGARVFDREHFKFRVGSRLHIRELGGYEGDPLALRRYAGLLDLAYADPHALGHANVAYVAGVKGPRTMTLAPDFKSVRPQIFAVPAVAPAVAWYPKASLVPDEPAAIAALRTTPPGSRAILEEASLAPDERSAVARLGGQGDVVPGRIVALARNHLSAEVDAPGPGLVVVDEAYHPGWTATVDGAPAHVLPANGAFRAVLVGAGKHTIEMRFGLGAVGWLMILSPFGMAVALALTRRRGS